MLIFIFIGLRVCWRLVSSGGRHVSRCRWWRRKRKSRRSRRRRRKLEKRGERSVGGERGGGGGETVPSDDWRGFVRRFPRGGAWSPLSSLFLIVRLLNNKGKKKKRHQNGKKEIVKLDITPVYINYIVISELRCCSVIVR